MHGAAARRQPMRDERENSAGTGRERHRPIGEAAIGRDQHARQAHGAREHDALHGDKIALRGRAAARGRRQREEGERAEVGRAERQRMQACRAGSAAAGGASAIAPQRITAPAAPTRMSVVGAIGSRAETANKTISASTPSAHKAPIVVPSKPSLCQSMVEKP